MDLGLTDKVAWVLGASSGLGRGAARALAREGCAVALTARDPERLRQATDEIAGATGATCIAAPADVTDSAALEAAARRAIEELGGIDILVANAGGPPPGTFDDFDDDALYDAFTLTAASAWRATKLVVDSMRARGGGAIVYITSVSTKEVIDGLLLSNMMRAAVTGMAKTLSRELARDGIRVVCAAPGQHDTPRVTALEEARAAAEGISSADARGRTTSSIPLGRLGDADDFGAAVAFLASPAASFVTGVTLTVDGGALRTVTA